MRMLQMKCFVSMANAQKMTETANLYHLQVSTLSKYMDHMEDELHVKLFQKNQNKLELTKEGEIIYPSIEFIVKKYDDLLIHMNRFTAKHRNTLSIALVFHQSQLLRLLSNYSKCCPEVELKITECMAADIQSRLNTSNVDIAIIYEELLDKKYPQTIPIREDRLVAIVGRDHPFAQKDNISLAELQDERLFLFKGDSLMYRYQIHACIKAGFAPMVSNHNLRVSTIMQYVARNCGVSLLIENTVNRLKRDEIVIVPLDENPTLRMSMVFPAAYLSDTCEQLAQYLIGNYQPDT